MAKKTAKAKTAKVEPASAEEFGKVRMELRADAELYESMRKLADEQDISLNQLIQGMCRGCMAHALPGEALVSDDGVVNVRTTKRCVFFGKIGSHEFIASEHGDDMHDGVPGTWERVSKGFVWFGLDFTDRGFVRYDPR